jgi:hypothetical protein
MTCNHDAPAMEVVVPFEAPIRPVHGHSRRFPDFHFDNMGSVAALISVRFAPTRYT